MHVRAFSEAGGHPHNEDAFAVEQPPGASGWWLCFVADGQGGQAGGGPAARLACQTALAFASRQRADVLRDPHLWVEMLRRADLAVRDEPTAGFTTLVALGVNGRQVVGASCGDSAALLVGKERTVILTSRQMKNPPIGSRGAIPIPFVAALKVPWKILALTDGVWKYAGWDRIDEAARQDCGDALVAELQALARLPGSGQFPDDFTVVVLEGVENQEKEE